MDLIMILTLHCSDIVLILWSNTVLILIIYSSCTDHMLFLHWINIVLILILYCYYTDPLLLWYRPVAVLILCRYWCHISLIIYASCTILILSLHSIFSKIQNDSVLNNGFWNNNEEAVVAVLFSYTQMFALTVSLDSFKLLYNYTTTITITIKPLYNLFLCIVLIDPKIKHKKINLVKFQSKPGFKQSQTIISAN